MTASDSIDGTRLWGRLMDMAQIGATPAGGVNRQALTPLDAQARRTLADWALSRGFAVEQDAIGNLFVSRPGRRPDLPPVMTGSHLDTQPTGGRFDGAYGVLAGFEALQALADAGIETERTVTLVAWTNEEGARFLPGMMGSAVYCGKLKVESLLDISDPDGVPLRDALRETLALTADVPARPPGGTVAAYVEAHIEQGPVLEAAGEVIGAVTAIQSMNSFEIDFFGVEAHAGATPRAGRSDAMLAAVETIAALEAAAMDEADALRFTVGRMAVKPGSPNTVPSHVRFSIDLRHPDDSEIARMRALIERLPGEIASRRRCRAEVACRTAAATTHFDPAVVDAVDAARQALGLPGRRMPSGAGHDAMHMARIAPTGMVFVPCKDGLSHNEAEDAEPAHLEAGAKVLADVLVRLAGE